MVLLFFARRSICLLPGLNHSLPLFWLLLVVPSFVVLALEAIATMTTSPIDDPLVANNLGARDMCAAVVGVVRVCLTATVQNRDLYFHALRGRYFYKICSPFHNDDSIPFP